MSVIERQAYLQRITRRLIVFTGTVLLLVAILLYGFTKSGFYEAGRHSYLVLLVFISGLLGGFVSIQQRLPGITLDELTVISSSWLSITLMPINGGIFAMVLMLMFIGGIIKGTLFPVYPDNIAVNSVETFNQWLTSTYPVHGTDVAKLLFWSFVAGFSERFVPQIIKRTTAENKADTSH